MKNLFLVLILMLLTTAVSYGAFGTFTIKTVGASDTVETVDLSNPQKNFTGEDISANSLTTANYVDALKYQLNGFDALTATGTNMFAGGCGNSTVTGTYNFGLGMPNAAAPSYKPLGSITTGNHNLAIGFYSLLNLTSGGSNIAIGNGAGQAITGASFNTLIGYETGLSVNGNGNFAVGLQALKNGASANYTTALGYSAGATTASGNLETVTDGVFIGRHTKALEDDSTNEVVIGYDAIGAGDNSVTIGSDSIQVTNLKGDLKVKTGAYTRLRTDEVFELPNDGVATSAVDFLIGLDAELGCLKVYDREGVAVAAEYYFSSSATVKAWGDAKFTTTEDNPGTINIFKSASTGTPIVIQNKTGSVISIGMLWFGAE